MYKYHSIPQTKTVHKLKDVSICLVRYIIMRI